MIFYKVATEWNWILYNIQKYIFIYQLYTINNNKKKKNFNNNNNHDDNNSNMIVAYIIKS